MVLAVTLTQVTTMDSLKNKINEIEKEEILKALKECDWIMARAARKLGITERMIGYKVRKYSIRKEGEEDSVQVSVNSEQSKEELQKQQ